MHVCLLRADLASDRAMRFAETALPGVIEIAPVAHCDQRGSFMRLYESRAFVAAGIDFAPADVNLSRNPHPGTLRGLHFQNAPFEESKLVRVVSGRIFDVVVDLRPESVAHGRWCSRELSAQRAEALFIPEGCAHGFLTLEADTDVLYQMGRAHEPNQSQGLRYDDAAFGITWPFEPRIISQADLNWPPFTGRRPRE